MTSWDAARPDARLRRFRGDIAPAPSATAWREQRRAATVQRVRNERVDEPAEPVIEARTGRLHIDADGVFAFALVLPMLFMVQLGALGAAMVAGLVPLYLFVRRRQLSRVLIPRLFLFVIPVFCLLSVVWSEAPRESFKYAAELGITVIAGLLLSSARSQEAVVRGLALAFLTYIAVSLTSGGTVAIGVGAGGQALSGLTSSKNLLADIASTGLIISMAMIAMAIRGRQWLWVGVGAFAVILQFHAVVAARSAGALLGLGIGVSAMLGLLVLIAAGKIVRAWLTTVLAVVLLAVGLSYRWLATTMIEVGANLFDKDPTLTGRTYLWYRAADLIQEKPLLGRGYYAFWLQGNTDAEGLWRYFGIDSRGGFTFHNTLVDILVTLGWSGAVVFLGTVLIGTVFLIKKFVQRPSLALVMWISIFLYQLARMPIETIGLAPFYFSTMLAFAALGAAFGRVRPLQPARAAYRRPQLVRVQAVDYAGQSPHRASLRILRPDAGVQG
jgi:exopolysaccharide production protein ExoQ